MEEQKPENPNRTKLTSAAQSYAMFHARQLVGYPAVADSAGMAARTEQEAKREEVMRHKFEVNYLFPQLKDAQRALLAEILRLKVQNMIQGDIPQRAELITTLRDPLLIHGVFEAITPIQCEILETWLEPETPSQALGK